MYGGKVEVKQLGEHIRLVTFMHPHPFVCRSIWGAKREVKKRSTRC
jgi:hypothetical protein